MRTPSNRTIEHTMGRGTPLWSFPFILLSAFIFFRMAPEVRVGHKYSFPADIFSLGVLLLELFEVDLPDYDADVHLSFPSFPSHSPQNQTIVLRTYAFPSAPVVLPCMRLTPTNRPTAETVGKQVDYVLCILSSSSPFPFPPFLFVRLYSDRWRQSCRIW